MGETGDCNIWSVIGNASNLVARFEALIPDVGGSMNVNESTYRAVGGAVRHFTKKDAVSTCSRSEPIEFGCSITP